jgi:hypothetical protein
VTARPVEVAWCGSVRGDWLFLVQYLARCQKKGALCIASLRGVADDPIIIYPKSCYSSLEAYCPRYHKYHRTADDVTQFTSCALFGLDLFSEPACYPVHLKLWKPLTTRNPQSGIQSDSAFHWTFE